MSKSKRMTKQQLLGEIAFRTDITKRKAAEVMEVLRDVVIEQLGSAGSVVIPELAKLTLKQKAATPERQGKNPFTGEAVTIKAKPASKTVKVVALKALKDSVS